MRTKLLLSIMMLGFCTTASADPSDIYDNYRNHGGDHHRNDSSFSSEQHRILANERFETEMLREEAQQENYRQQIESRHNSQRMAENSRQIQENQARYENNSNMINNVNQAANSITSVVRQVQVLSSGHPGW